MTRAQRDKGARGEREVAAIFRAHGFDCDRTPNSGGLRIAGDLYGNVPVHVEVKRQETLRLWEWLAQAEAECSDQVPAVVFRRNSSKWYAVLALDELASLLRRARLDGATASAYDARMTGRRDALEAVSADGGKDS